MDRTGVQKQKSSSKMGNEWKMANYIKGVFDSNEAYGLNVQNIQFKGGKKKKLFKTEHIWIIPS